MGIMIIPGGCRKVDNNGQSVRKSCDTCMQPGICAMEPRARELAELISQQWVSARKETPPAREDLLYLERSSRVPSGIVHHGYYDESRKVYIAWATDHTLPANAVIAWMLVPPVPETIHQSRKSKGRNSGKPVACLNSVEG
jgi:hypothetical protein